jgi:D-glycero-alpha-D-manno-heptose-7-phosphate kinase
LVQSLSRTVLSATINKYLYISIRKLPNFFNHKYRIVWSKIENVKTINQIDHKVVKELLKYYRIKDGLEIHYDGDLPARSGMGSSSAFVVGSIKAINAYNNKNLSKYDLSKKSIEFEQNFLKENVGSQDQIAATYGGVNRIDFNKKKIKIKKLKNNLKKLENNLALIYTNINRTAHEIAETFINKLQKIKKAILMKS